MLTALGILHGLLYTFDRALEADWQCWSQLGDLLYGCSVDCFFGFSEIDLSFQEDLLVLSDPRNILPWKDGRGTILYKHTGLVEREIEESRNQIGHLDELTASNILAGPFKLQLTSLPSEHLKFTEPESSPTVQETSDERRNKRSKSVPTLMILHLEAVLELYPLHRSGFGR
jgi:hypothetical protein